MAKAKKLKMYSALEVANLCGVVNQTAINWIRGKHLKAVTTPGGQYRVYKEDLIAFMNNRGMRLPKELRNEDDVAYMNAILIIDDDKALNDAMAQFLEKNTDSFSIHQSFDGFDAGITLEKIKPGFIVLDLDLPGVDGFEICRQLKTRGEYGSPYVMVITGLEDEKIENKVKKIGADAFFRKPVEFAEILENIKNNQR